MANENDGLYISASLNIEQTENNIIKNDIPKINSDLVSDPKAKIKLNAEVDEIKAKSNIQSQFNSIASKLKLNIDSASIDTNKVVEPLRKGFKQLFTEIANTKLVDTNSMAKTMKSEFVNLKPFIAERIKNGDINVANSNIREVKANIIETMKR